MLIDEVREVEIHTTLTLNIQSITQTQAGSPPTIPDGAIVKDLGATQLVIPGLNDAHIHVGYMGESMEYADCHACNSIEELQATLSSYCKKHASNSWIVGVGWDHSGWGRYPVREDLDQVESTRPIVLYRACWHICVCNTVALQQSELLASLLSKSSSSSSRGSSHQEEVPGGTIDMDPKTGLPSGILREAAVTLVTSHISEADESLRISHFSKALSRCVEKGLTSVQTNDTNAWKIYQILQEQGKKKE